MAYKKIGVFGATGGLGQAVTQALVEAGFEVVPFSRQKTTVAGVDTQPIGSLVGFDAIVSTIGRQGIKEQLAIIEKAKKDGVKRFIPSEFGIDHRSEPRTAEYPVFEAKMEVYEAVKAADFPDGWTAIAAGLFEFTIPVFVGLDSNTSTITIAGPGKKIFPFTMRSDIGRMVAHTLTQPQEYKDAWVPVANCWFSLSEIAVLVRDLADHDMRIQHAELTEKTPLLKIFEPSDMQIMDRSQTLALPIELTDMEEWIKAAYKRQYAQQK